MPIRIKGMTCAVHIQKAIERMDGVEAASLNFATEKLNVRYDPERVASEQIGAKVRAIGYDVAEEQIELGLGGMSCAACAARIEKVLARAQGVRKAAVNLATQTAAVEYDASQITPEQLSELVSKAGYSARVREEGTAAQAQKEREEEIRRVGRLALLSAILTSPLLFTMFFMMTGKSGDIFTNPWFQFLLATPVQFLIGYRYITAAPVTLCAAGALTWMS